MSGLICIAWQSFFFTLQKLKFPGTLSQFHRDIRELPHIYNHLIHLEPLLNQSPVLHHPDVQTNTNITATNLTICLSIHVTLFLTISNMNCNTVYTHVLLFISRGVYNLLSVISTTTYISISMSLEQNTLVYGEVFRKLILT